MGSRLQLHDVLLSIVPNVYFQPPEDMKLIYPCIIYERGFVTRTKFANDRPYQRRIRYEVKIIDSDPDSLLPDKVASLPMCIFERHYTSNNLNHDVYNLYY